MKYRVPTAEELTALLLARAHSEGLTVLEFLDRECKRAEAEEVCHLNTRLAERRAGMERH